MKAESKINVLWVHEHPQMSEMKKRPYNSVKEEEKPREKHTEMTMQINFYWLQLFMFMFARCVMRGRKVKFNRSGDDA